jgi:23S rRNA (uracil1939-C5)-methyltransferase
MKPRRPPHRSTELDATISELSPGGDGVAIVAIAGERRAVFLRGVSCGDRVRVAVDATTRPARGKVIALLEPGPDRVPSACTWSDVCGGCDWMHVSRDGQRTAHEAHVRGAFPREWQDEPIAFAFHPAPSSVAYRTRARVHARASGGRAIVGMNEARTRDPVEVERCAVLHPDLEAARGRLAPLLEGAHGRGEALLALGAIPTDANDGAPRPAVLDLHWNGALAASCFARLERAVLDGWLAGAQVTAGEARVPARIGDPTPWIRGGDGLPLRLAPGGFGQASDDGNALLSRRVVELARRVLDGKTSTRVVELYAGAGNFTVLLAPFAEQLVAVESARESCDAARANLEARALGSATRAHTKIVEADAGSFAIPPKTQLVLLDPPRTGARDVCARLPGSSVKHVLYVSCDTQTLARDLALLSPTFAPRAVEVFELFPQTSHVETVVHFERRRP